jgi:N-terminal C2 in EEIG1 and EHBP1 proteins
VPYVTGKSFIKWHLPHSAAAEHRGRTDKCAIKDHKVAYNYETTIPVRLVVDKNGMLQESFIYLEVLHEVMSAGKGERICLGHVRINMAEYVEASEQEGEEGVTRRHLLQDSKINSTLKVRLFRYRFCRSC